MVIEIMEGRFYFLKVNNCFLCDEIMGDFYFFNCIFFKFFIIIFNIFFFIYKKLFKIILEFY